jgi:2-keto-4-pentenoate hydratase
MPFNPNAAARFVAEAHRTRAAYCNLPDDLVPKTVDEAYAAQEALAELWAPRFGQVGGLKIATTTKIMQRLMGIDHPCGGMLFANRIFPSGKSIRRADYVNLVVECELAVRLDRDLPVRATPYSRGDARAAIGSVMAAFELIEDRNAVYTSTDALSLIADNAWNGGIVIGPETAPPPGHDLDGLTGKLWINGDASGTPAKTGTTDDPMGALAWVANLAAGRGRPLRAGQVVITGSVIPTLPIAPGDMFRFQLDSIGATEMTAA